MIGEFKMPECEHNKPFTGVVTVVSATSMVCPFCERDRMRADLERMRPVYDFVVAHNLGRYRVRAELRHEDRNLFDKLGLLVDAARGELAAGNHPASWLDCPDCRARSKSGEEPPRCEVWMANERAKGQG